MSGESWWSRLPAPAQWLLRWLALVLANLLLVGAVCLVMGWTDALRISNALFFDAAALLLLGLLIQWAAPAHTSAPAEPGPPPATRPEREREQPRVEQMLEERWRRRQRPIHGWAALCFTAAVAIFGISLLVPAVWGGGGL
ncbi:MAG: hypothetical protein H5T60_11590 [Anaerolineae bacterium]|nr:hypothetical protein [Anaerolineae bacterium]